MKRCCHLIFIADKLLDPEVTHEMNMRILQLATDERSWEIFKERINLVMREHGITNSAVTLHCHTCGDKVLDLFHRPHYEQGLLWLEAESCQS